MNEQTIKSKLRAFRIIGMLEGLSFLILLGIAMPLKYYAGMPLAVKYVGWAHGLLFVLYLATLLQAQLVMRWKFKWLAAAAFASVLPFGPFVVDKKLVRVEAYRGK